MPRYTAVLDACVLVPIALADALLRVAEKGLYRRCGQIAFFLRLRRPSMYQGCGSRSLTH